LQVCCGSTYVTRFYATYEAGVYTKFPSASDFGKAVAWARSVGFNAMEFEVLNRNHLKKLLADRRLGRAPPGFEAASVSFPFVFSSFLGEPWARARDGFALCLGAARRFGAPVVNLTSPPYPGAELSWDGPYPGGPPAVVAFHGERGWRDAWESFVSRVGLFADMAAGEGVKLAVEPRPREMVGNTDALLMLIRDVGSRNLGALFDTGHHFVMKEILPVSVWKLGDRIFSVHLSDNDGVIEHHWAPGEGRIDWGSVLGALGESGYAGYLAVESSGIGRDPADFVSAKALVEGLLSAWGRAEGRVAARGLRRRDQG
jgi:sugar phosphate isomerase/epimerase